MNAILRALIVAAVSAVTASGCYYQECPVQTAGAYGGQAYVQVDAPPPPLQASAEVRPPKPQDAAVWVHGYWDWRGRWFWVEGHWETPRPGYVWTAPVARRAPEGGIHYHPGHWRPERSSPPPVYQQPGEVVVSVRPAAPATVDQGGSATVRVPGQPAQQGGTAQQGGSGTVVVRPGGTTEQAGTPQGGSGTVVVTPGGAVQQGGTGTRLPAVQSPGTGQVRPGAVQGGPATVRPGSGGQPATVVRPAGGPVARPGTAVPSGPGVQGPTAETVQLSCRVTAARAPAGGYVTITGRGWGSSPVVKVGGQMAAVVQSTRDSIRVRLPHNAVGGPVTVTDASRTSSCGSLQIIGR